MFKSPYKTSILSIIALLTIGGSFIAGIYIGYENRPEITKVSSIINKESAISSNTAEKVDFSPFWKTWNEINEKFVDTNNATSTANSGQDKIWGAIKGLVGSLEDPYSVFLPPSDSRIFEENISGSFGGVGIEIGIRDDVLTVIAPLKDTPAYRAGMLSGDKIIKVDDTTTARLSIDGVVKIIRGEVGTPVVLTVVREDEEDPIEITIVRGIIIIPTIDTEIQSGGSTQAANQNNTNGEKTKDKQDVFVIKLYNFSAVSPDLFKNSLREFLLTGSDKLIIDLRGNPGGFLQAAVDIASWFLPAGKIIVIEDFGGQKENTTYRSRGYNIFNENLKIVILVNQGSASASEILAGALSEHGMAKIVGQTTFGKGSVQELIKITPDTSLKLTVAHWLTPNGNLISKGGITPDYEVQITPEDREAGRDPQMKKALEILRANLN